MSGGRDAHWVGGHSSGEEKYVKGSHALVRRQIEHATRPLDDAAVSSQLLDFFVYSRALDSAIFGQRAEMVVPSVWQRIGSIKRS